MTRTAAAFTIIGLTVAATGAIILLGAMVAAAHVAERLGRPG